MIYFPRQKMFQWIAKPEGSKTPNNPVGIVYIMDIDLIFWLGIAQELKGNNWFWYCPHMASFEVYPSGQKYFKTWYEAAQDAEKVFSGRLKMTQINYWDQLKAFRRVKRLK